MTVTDVDPVVIAALRDVFDPCCREKGISVVDMGLLRSARIDAGVARVELVLTSGWCPFAATILTEIEGAVRTLPDVHEADVAIVWDEPWTTDRLSAEARTKLRFLPPPTEVDSPRSYVAANWPAAEPSEPTQRGGNDDR